MDNIYWTLTTFWALLSYVIYKNWFNPPNNPLKWVLLFPSFSRWKSWRAQRMCNLPNISCSITRMTLHHYTYMTPPFLRLFKSLGPLALFQVLRRIIIFLRFPSCLGGKVSLDTKSCLSWSRVFIASKNKRYDVQAKKNPKQTINIQHFLV